MATTTSTTPSGAPHRYNTMRSENKTLYWVLGVLALVLLAGIVYAYSGRGVETMANPAMMGTTPMTLPSERGAMGNDSQMNMGVAPRTTDTLNPPPSDINPATGSNPDQVR